MCFMETNISFLLIYLGIAICFHGCICVQQNEYVSIVKTFSMIIHSASRWDGGRWRIWRNMFGVVISPVHFGRGLFCHSNFNFFYIDEKEETIFITRSSHSNLQLFLNISKHYNFKQNKPIAYWIFVKYFFYLWEVAAVAPKKRLPCWRILLGKHLHRCFWRNIMANFTTIFSQNTTHFCIFSIVLSICCCCLVVYYLTKSLWNCVSGNQICCSGCCSLFLTILICRLHMTIFVGAVWKFSLVLWN